MPTHQSLSGSTDDDLVQRMVASHPDRFGEAFWEFFAAHVAPLLPARPTMIDLGCGPGLWLRDLGQRFPAATLYGYDVTPAMIAHGRQVAYAGATPTLSVRDVTSEPLPTYLTWRREGLGESQAESLRRGFRLFPAHSKYTIEDWRWLLAQAGFAIRHQGALRASHQIFVTEPETRSRP